MRPETDPINDKLTELYRTALTPAPLELDAPALWFEAGRAAARAERSARGWQAYSLVSTAAAAVLAIVVVQQREALPIADSAPPAPTIVMTEPVVAPEPEPIAEPFRTPSAPTPPAWALWFVAATPDPDSYLGRRDLVLREGIDALPEPPRVEGVYNASLPIEPPPTAARLLRMYLPAEKSATTKTDDPQADQSSSHSEKLA